MLGKVLDKIVPILAILASLILAIIIIEGFVCKLYPECQQDIDYYNEVIRRNKVKKEYWKRHPDEYQDKLKQIQR